MIFAAAVALLQVALVGAASEWVYAYSGEPKANEKAQTATWGGLCTTGKEQSPINVVTSATVKTVNPVIETHFDTDVSYVKNTGHGFQLFETSPANHSYNATSAGISEVDNIGGSKGYSFIGGAKFNFYQVHWHSPSENTVDGTSFPLEAHFVHQLDDKALHGGYHRLAVIGLLYDLSTECNKVLDKFWDVFPKAKGVAPYAGDALNLNAKLNDELKSGYYHWYGSLTTPPCTEGVSWNLLKRRQKVCQQQLDHIKTALGTTQKGINFNNRVPMPLNHRIVTETDPGATKQPVNAAPLESSGKWLYANKGETSANAGVQASTWGGLCKTGHEQSPINVVTASTQQVGHLPITTHMNAKASYVKNTGHGFQVFETSPKGHKYNNSDAKYISVDDASGSAKGYSKINGEKFNFYQVHWHTPSENTIDGKSFPLEAHFVHQLDDDALHGTYHRLAVIGLLYELGECNEFLDKFWSTFPSSKGVAKYTGDDFDLNTKLTMELEYGYYHWYGSLTTPPCTEGVSWNLLKKTEKVCQQQVDRLKAALAATQDGIGFNNRVTMPVHHRIVTAIAGTTTKTKAPPPPSTPVIKTVATVKVKSCFIAQAMSEDTTVQTAFTKAMADSAGVPEAKVKCTLTHKCTRRLEAELFDSARRKLLFESTSPYSVQAAYEIGVPSSKTPTDIKSSVTNTQRTTFQNTLRNNLATTSFANEPLAVSAVSKPSDSVALKGYTCLTGQACSFSKYLSGTHFTINSQASVSLSECGGRCSSTAGCEAFEHNSKSHLATCTFWKAGACNIPGGSPPGLLAGVATVNTCEKDGRKTIFKTISSRCQRKSILGVVSSLIWVFLVSAVTG